MGNPTPPYGTSCPVCGFQKYSPGLGGKTAELVALINPDEYEFVDEDYFNSIALPTGSTASPITKKSAAKQIQKMVEN